MSDLARGLEFEQWLLDTHFGQMGYKKNPNKYKIDLVQTGWPSIEAKRENASRPERLPDGSLKNIAVQIFVKHDPICLVQIPAAVSNGTHCYKPQEGAEIGQGSWHARNLCIWLVVLVLVVRRLCAGIRISNQNTNVKTH